MDATSRALRMNAIRDELRRRLSLPGWSNVRGDDVIDRVQALDAAGRIEVNRLFVELQELKDEDDASSAAASP